ncbi:MAG: DEAD/DEAH box helicase [Verrucomicrobiales bacterium]|nr:DEAD/DEAH box helicase [Verrucomicrobiales bacterium]
MPDLLTAIPGLLQAYPPELRREAERLAEDGAVVTLDGLPEEAQSELRLDDTTVSAEWRLIESRWQGETDAPEELRDLALCLVLVAAARSEESPASESPEREEDQFEVWLEGRLRRQLREAELGYVEKVERRFLRVRAAGEIFDQDMVRLNPKWTIDTTEPLELWPSPPETLREFWNYVAHAMEERGLQMPAFMRQTAELDKVRTALSAWRQRQQIPLWKDRVRKLARELLEQTPPRVLHADARLIIGGGDEMRVQILTEGDDTFQPVLTSDLNSLAERQRRGLLRSPVEAELLLRACLAEFQAHGLAAMRLDEPAGRRLLANLLARSEVATRVLNLDEKPFRRVDAPLHWEASLDEDDAFLQLRLFTESGAEAPLPLRVLPGQPTLYLSEDAAYHGPTWIGDSHVVEDALPIPIDALESEDGVFLLRRLDLPLPEPLARRVKEEPLEVRIQAHCLPRGSFSNVEYAILRMDAVDPSGKPVERLRPGGWDHVQDPTPTAKPQRKSKVLPSAEPAPILVRDRRRLHQAEQLLDGFRSTFDVEHQGYRVRMTKTFPEQFLEWSQQLPAEIPLETDDRLASIIADPLKARVRLEARQTDSIDWFDLQVVFEIEGAELKTAEIRRLIAARGGFVRFADGSWKRVELELTEEQQAMIDQLGIELTELGEDFHRLHWRQLAADQANQLISPRAWTNIRERLEKARVDEHPPVPEELAITLRPYQVEGFHFLVYLARNRFGGILADDMGLGKTLQSIAWILWLRADKRRQIGPDKPLRPSLVVCPKSVLDVWQAELEKAAPSLRVQVLRERDAFDLEQFETAVDVLVVNYAQLRSLAEDLKNTRLLATILDEGQQIKNPDSLSARAARELKADNRVVLTGTPLENRLLDLWSLMTFATPGALGDRRYFQKHFDRRKDAQAAERLSARLRPFLIRRTKAQVARDLPPRTEETVLSEMSPVQARIYKEELARAQQMVLASTGFEAGGRGRFAMLQALTRLRQICCHPSLVGAGSLSADSAKLEATLEHLQELHEAGHKVLLFSQFVRMLELLRHRLEERGLPHHWLTGATKDRGQVVRNFQEDPEASVFLISLKAGGSGLNLTAASYVILYDPWWNPAVEAQAIDRAHRIGQTEPVIAYRMITKGTIEEKIMLLQQKKQFMAAGILGENTFAQGLSRDDFAYLFDLEEKEADLQRDLNDRSYEASLKGEF